MSVGLGVALCAVSYQIRKRYCCITGVRPARTSVDGRVFMGPAESYFGRASLPVALVYRCDLSHSVSSCSLHGALEVVQPLGRSAVGCVFVPFLWAADMGCLPSISNISNWLLFRIFRFMMLTLCLTSPR